MLHVGLTGNIAVGKSVVRQMLQHLGAYPIDADGLSHQAMQPGAPAYKPVVDTFGQFILGPDKRINRALLGQIVFSNPEALAKLEAIVHPVVRQAINTLVARSKQRVVVIEAIKLLATRYGSTPKSRSLETAPAALLVCSVLKTRCPVRELWMAMRAVSSSRISPTMMMSGS